jgi:hypothetical protein
MSIEAMKKALEALEAVRWSRHLEDARTIAKNARYSLRQAIEQAEQWDTSDMAHRSGGLSVEQEPVAWLVSDAQGRYATIRDPSLYKEEVYEPLYTAPPKREWVGLTDEEIKGILDCGRGGLVDIKKAEQILREKNHD